MKIPKETQKKDDSDAYNDWCHGEDCWLEQEARMELVPVVVVAASFVELNLEQKEPHIYVSEPSRGFTLFVEIYGVGSCSARGSVHGLQKLFVGDCSMVLSSPWWAVGDVGSGNFSFFVELSSTYVSIVLCSGSFR
ncbi:hypothetical protein RYX36_001227 [Vicia faba]